MTPEWNPKCSCNDRLYYEGELTEDDKQECWKVCIKSLQKSTHLYKPAYNKLVIVERDLEKREKREYLDSQSRELLDTTRKEIEDILENWDKEVDEAYALFDKHHPGKRELTDDEEEKPKIYKKV